MHIKKNIMRGAIAVGMSVAALFPFATTTLAQGNCPNGQVHCQGIGGAAGACMSAAQCQQAVKNLQQQNAGGVGNINIQLPKNGGFFADFGSLSSLVLRIVLVIAAILVFGYLIMGGLEWITSGGEKSKTESARNKITAAVVGLIILVSSWALMSLIVHFLGYNDLNQLIQQNL